MALVSYFKKIFSTGLKYSDEKTRNQVFLFNFFATVFGFICAFSGLRYLLKDEFIPAIFFISILFLDILTIIFFPPQKSRRIGKIILLSLFSVSSVYIFWFGVNVHFGWMFIFLFPVFSIKIFGEKNGIILAASLALIMASGHLIPVPEVLMNTDLLFNINFFAIYFLALVIMYIFEQNKAREISEFLEKAKVAEKELIQKNEFVSDLSHQLRTSLSNIILVNNLIYSSSLDKNQKELIDTLKASTNNLLEAVNKIIDFSQPDLVQKKEIQVSFNLVPNLNSIVSLFSDKTDANINLDVSPNIQNLLIGDPIKLKQIFLNLLQSIIFSGNSSLINEILIKILPEKETKTDMQVSFNIEVLYKSPGLFPENSEREGIVNISELANTKKLINYSGGNLKIRQGENFEIFNFILAYQKDLIRKSEDSLEKIHIEEPKSISLKNANVLLVEDNLINQKIVLLSLKNLVGNLDLASNGKEALDKFGTTKYDIILMDIQMPVMDGIVATKKIREIESITSTQTPIIAITANALSGDRETCLAVGMNDYISKPFQVDILVQKMRTLLIKKNQ